MKYLYFFMRSKGLLIPLFILFSLFPYIPWHHIIVLRWIASLQYSDPEAVLVSLRFLELVLRHAEGGPRIVEMAKGLEALVCFVKQVECRE